MALLLQSLSDSNRYEQFQTLSIHLLADLVNAIICVPLYAIYAVVEDPKKDFGNHDEFLRSSLHCYQPQLAAGNNNKYLLGISYDRRYSIWKSNGKALLLIPTACKLELRRLFLAAQARTLISKRTL